MKHFLVLLLITTFISLYGSNDVKDTGPEMINGHQLPPEPDPTINNSTLLGIDSNNNGVRDDVERWIILRYQNDANYPKTKTAIAIQFAKAYQYIIANDPKYSYENKTYKKVDYALDCQGYMRHHEIRKYHLRGTEIAKFHIENRIYDNSFREKLFNTKERLKAYFYYNSSLSGHTYGGGGGVLSSTKDKCDFDIDALDELL